MRTEVGKEDTETIRMLVGAAVPAHKPLVRCLCRPITRWAEDNGVQLEVIHVVGVSNCIKAFMSHRPRYALFTGMSWWTPEQLALLSTLRTDRVDWAMTTAGILTPGRTAMLRALQVTVIEIPCGPNAVREHFIRTAA